MTIQSIYDPGFRCKKDAVFSGLSWPGAGVLFSEVAGHLGDAAFLERTAEWPSASEDREDGLVSATKDG